MIEGVKIIPKKQIIDERGKIMHMMRNDDPNFTKFGEIYFSYSHPNTVKAWHLHKRMTVNYVCVIGKIKLVLFDDRPESSTKGELQEIFLTTENYSLVTVPARVWNGFKSVENKFSIIANCSDIPHEAEEMSRKPFDDPYFNYNWNIKLG
ncbi:polysaccharide biosynthesis domain protein [Candidatus Pelagibacter sp. HTCC7211]|mgnify:FL=1|jgi:dTDP-4-dehydrorhamnose 3,5-epimerase|uniref:dTDP-4-dehydrorhamnose 3,5-epimerase family protein n=1 Tax=Pelagibacter sp. (strain HTCC7211) TaxID=439493 RepID=UPI000183A1E1|nr:dTDP-4-dehydrorhamnose 3,5-epimerase family protein [Candidatus Pelagibacter sp. HTCC7211]EDZ60912.1 polysaccharide biosynthesis domain protein [Candidatus Pelagibacter sp. HTCC7211]MBD1151133.1 dTDP-4-dehydrorhamnose 3,5-epimerase family protein [Pelagibacterales bacterium SAG-MED25]